MKIHTDEVKARAANVAPAFVVVANKTAGALPGVPRIMIHPANGIDTVERLSGPAGHQHPRYTIHAVDISYNNVAGLLEDLKAQFIDPHGRALPFDIPGWLIQDVKWSEPQPVQVDTDTSSPQLLYGVAELSFDADPV